MAGELTLSVVLGALLSVGVVDDAVSGAGHDLLTVGVGHELCAEDVRPMTRAYGLLDLQKETRNRVMAGYQLVTGQVLGFGAQNTPTAQ